MIVFRICKEQYKNDLSGKGAELAGGRWNSKGVPLLYTAGNRALAMTEMAVNLPYGILPKNYYILTIHLPDEEKLISEVKADQLPKDWKNLPHPHSTQEIGNKFVSIGIYLMLKVPSAVVQGDHNFLINPRHPAFSKIQIEEAEAFDFDKRLFDQRT